MPLKHIRLELARDHEFPSGSRERGYEFVAPLDDDGHLVAKEWQTARERCHVKRFWADEPAELGYLVHRPGGTWAFDYDPTRSSDDEPGFKLDNTACPRRICVVSRNTMARCALLSLPESDLD